MNNFCSNCGSKINPETGLCPQCAQQKVKISQANHSVVKKTNPQPKKSRKAIKIVVPIIAVILAITIAISSLIVVPKIIKSKAVPSGYTSFSYGFTNVKITDEESVIEAIGSVSDVIGITDAKSELKVEDTYTVENDSYYRVQQYYKGIPVYGRTICVSADEKGNGTALTSNYVVFDKKIDTNPSVKQKVVDKSVKSYLENDEITVPQLDESKLIIYCDDETNKQKLAYRLDLSEVNGIGEIIIDAKNGDVLSFCSNVNNESAPVTNKSGTITTTGWRNDDGSYHLYNDEYKASVYDLKNANTKEEYLNFHVTYKIDTVYSKNDVFDDKGIAVLRNTIDISRYYKDLSFPCFYMLDVGFNEDDKYANNACAYFETIKGLDYGGIQIGEQQDVNRVDLIAHEFTHLVTDKIVDWAGAKGQTGAINEGYSDFFGELIDEYCWSIRDEQHVEMDWVHGARVVHNPQLNGYPDSVDDANNTDQDYQHAYSTVVSHSGYLMWNGIDGSYEKIDSNLLAELWYRALFLMQSNADYAQFRKAIELTARIMIADYDLNMEQYKTIQKAFDEVGIYDTEPLTYNNVVKNKFDLIVLNKNETEDVSYNVRIFNTLYKEEFLFKEMDNISSGHTFNFSDGLYHIEITDSNKDNALSEPIVIRVLVNGRWPNAQDTVKVHTDFTEAIYEQIGGQENETTDSESSDTDLIKELTEGYWEQGVQSKYIHKFNSDGTGMVYGVADILESDGSLDMSKLGSCKSFSPFTWEINGDYLDVYGEGESVKYKWVSLSDNYDWDEGIRHHLPANENFFYETGYVPDEYGLTNALYLKRYHEVKKSDAEIYSEHLKNGGIKKYIDITDYTITSTESCLIDINDDGVLELLLNIYVDRGIVDPPEMDVYGVLLGIQNGKVVKLLSACHEAMIGGGDYLTIKYDTIMKKHVVHYEWMAYDGSPGVLRSYKVYTYDGKSLSEYVKISMILETDGDDFKYRINDKMVTESQYENAKSRFEDPTDKTYKMKLGTSNNPLGL